MISTKQKWLMGVLLAASGAVWMPQLVAKFGETSTSSSVVPDGPNEAEMAWMEDEFGGLRATETVGAVPPPIVETADGVAPDVDVSSVPVQGPGALAQQIASALGSSRTFGGTVPVERTVREETSQGAIFEEQPLPEVPVEPEPVEEAPPPPTIVFLEEHPLRGVIVGEKRSHAIFGSYLVSVGDALPGTPAVVAAISTSGAVVRDGTMSIDLTLPPLRAREPEPVGPSSASVDAPASEEDPPGEGEPPAAGSGQSVNVEPQGAPR